MKTKAAQQFEEILGVIQKEARRLTDLVESGAISVADYKRMMWENLGISPHCLKEGVSYIIKPPSS